MAPIRIFISYARNDKDWFQKESKYELIPYLIESLRKEDVIFWYDKELNPGDNFPPRIIEAIDTAHIALLIVSQSFLNSVFIRDNELPRIKARADQGELTAVPVLVEPCAWEENDFFSVRQMLPGKPTPLIDYTENEREWAHVRYEILDGLKKVIRKLRNSSRPTPPPPSPPLPSPPPPSPLPPALPVATALSSQTPAHTEVRQDNENTTPFRSYIETAAGLNLKMIGIEGIERTGGGYWMGATEVTNAQYKAFLKDSNYGGASYADPLYLRHFKSSDSDASASDDYPVVNVSWYNAMEFCYWLSKKTGKRYCLPSEAQWEHACLAGSTGDYCFGSDVSQLGEYAWYDANSGGKTHSVAQKKANQWGIYDMHGNVQEWGEDLFQAGGFFRALLGGCWDYGAEDCRALSHRGYDPMRTLTSLGFRVCRVGSHGVTPKQEEETPNCGLDYSESTAGLNMKMVWIDGNTQTGGGYWMGATQVTNAQYKAFLKDSGYDGSDDANSNYLMHIKGSSPWASASDDYPVVFINWKNAKAFCEWLSKKTGKRYCLPSEAKWEHACLAGSSGLYCFGSDASQLGEYAWYLANSGSKTHSVAQKRPNLCGLYDMHGNVWEWCEDLYEASGASRVMRGGDCSNNAELCRASARGGNNPMRWDIHNGFRVCRVGSLGVTPKQEEETQDCGPNYSESTAGLNMKMIRIDGNPQTGGGYWMGATTVTNAQYKAFLKDSGYDGSGDSDSNYLKHFKGSEPLASAGDDYPVVFVSWKNARAFCEWLSKKTGKAYCLSSEAQWEHACRAGSTGEYCFGSDASQLGEYAWYDANSGGRTHSVAQKKANQWGLYDMHGNVWERCEESFKAGGPSRVLRGGCWATNARGCCASYSNRLPPEATDSNLGFRVCRVGLSR